MACLNERAVRTRGLPADFSLTPPETFALYRTLMQVAPDSAVFQALKPADFFAREAIITKRRYRDYEAALKGSIVAGLQDGYSGLF